MFDIRHNRLHRCQADAESAILLFLFSNERRQMALDSRERNDRINLKSRARRRPSTIRFFASGDVGRFHTSTLDQCLAACLH